MTTETLVDDTPQGPAVGDSSLPETPSLDVVLAFVREDYADDFKRLETYRSRADTLLGFVGVMIGLVVAFGTDTAADRWMIWGTGFLLAAALIFLFLGTWVRFKVSPTTRHLAESYLTKSEQVTKLQIVANTLDAIRHNKNTIRWVQIVQTVGLCLVAAGTLVIGTHILKLA